MKKQMKEMLEKETPALKHELDDRRRHLFDLRSQAVTEKLEDPSQLKKTKKEIARILTVLRQRQTEATKADAAPKAPIAAAPQEQTA